MAAESILKNRQVSTMLKHGFISDPALSPSRIFLPRVSSTSPPPSFEKPRSSPTLFEMMSEEQQLQQQQQQQQSNLPNHHLHQNHQLQRESRPSDEKRRRLQDRVSRILAEAPFQSPAWAGGAGDVKLTVSSKDEFKVSMTVHRRVLAARSRFFAEKLGREAGAGMGTVAHSVEICDCDDVGVYVEVVVLMYWEEDLRRKLVGEDVGKVLSLLRISAALMFDAGIMACLEFLEAVPWSEDEEEKVIAVLGQLELYDTGVDVLQRVSVEPSISSRADGIFLQLLMGVLQAKDEKARREMKTLISGLLKEDLTHDGNNNKLDVSRDTLYHICHKCLSSLLLCLSEAVSVDESRCDRGVLMGQIAREADNLHWVVDILIEKKMGDDFVTIWADQTELASLHSKLPSMYRYEISRITAQLCIAVGRGQILVPKDARFSLLRTWLEPLYEDFGWMRRACKSIDKKLVEDGLTQTILTLPLAQQQAILLNWFDRFLNKGDDCPNIQRAFEVWWRRAFVRQYAADQDSSHLQITVCDYPA
ncbi:BTB/POZ domain-containing protein [Cinnamomum micranthum f. kanehirae]|uniref:BTB/POZ domain-containing protein n=1 Tax=Cinnamomum micranthum f. kanehirae TaxID=337451 RepID=A0A3S3Q9C3_9MAGN|nr:BTB/POZ domain-containing protein [Cinnamomum micranthum f. kanehirae]